MSHRKTRVSGLHETPEGQGKTGGPRRPILHIAGVLLVLASAGAWQTSVRDGTPDAAGDGPAAIEAAERHVRAIAATPHPIGSDAAGNVRRYLVDQLAGAGLHPEIQETTFVAEERSGVYRAARVRNIVARKRGFANTRTILLMAHYDSATYSPGAGDNAAGVAAIIEAVSRRTAGQPWRNDIIVLFTDGEEIGLYGARAFMDEHPFARDVGIVVNLEGRGNRGRAILFETGARSGWAVRAFAAASPYLFVNSLAPLIYERLPNNTDFTVFRRAGIPGLNFAFIDGWPRYHHASDTPERLSRESLREHVGIASAMVNALGDANLKSPLAEEFVYFDVLGLRVVTYSYGSAIVIGAVAVLAFLGFVAIALYRRRLMIGGVIVGFLAVPVAAALAAALSFGSMRVFYQWREAAAYANETYVVALVALAALVTWLVYAGLVRKTAAANLLTGALVWWGFATALTIVRAPAASYLFMWPFIGGLATLVSMAATESSSRASRIRTVGVLLGAVPAIAILPPMIWAFYASLPRQEAFLTAFLVPSLALVIAQARHVAPARWWIVPAGLTALSGAGFAVAATQAVFNPDQPKANFAEYVADADRGVAVWMIDGRRRDSWTDQFAAMDKVDAGAAEMLPAWYGAPGRTLRKQITASPAIMPAAPTVTVVTDVTRSGRRTRRLLLSSPRGAPEVALHVKAEGAIEAAMLDGQSLEEAAPMRQRAVNTSYSEPAASKGSELVLRYFAPPSTGTALEVTTEGSGPMRVSVLDRSYELPRGATSPRARGPAMVSGGDATIVIRSYAFP